MNAKYLAVDADAKLAKIEAAAWLKHGFIMDRVGNMTDAIQRLLVNEYLYVAINGDTIDFMSMLQTMRSVTNTPIFVITENFNTEAEVAALENGADLFSRWHENSDSNVASALAHITHTIERIKQPKPKVKVITYGNVLLSPEYRKAFVNDIEIKLTRTEFDIFCFLISNHNRVLTSKQIYMNVWDFEFDDDDESVNEVVKAALKRLRKKISDCGESNDIIKNVWGVGYCFLVDGE